MAASTNFDRTTAVQQQEPGRFTAELDGGWVVGGGVNGGYLLAIIGQALRATVPAKPDPVAVSAHYLSAAVPGPADLVVEVRRDGRRNATASVDLSQDGVARITALATLGDLDQDAESFPDVSTTVVPFDLPPREQCVTNMTAPEELRKFAPLMSRFEMLFHPDQAGWTTGQPNGTAEMSAWFRLEDERDPDPISLLLAVDSLPPATFNLGQMGWAPTLELTAHVRARPAPGWLRIRHASHNIAGGMFEEDCEVWDDAGRLVAQGRQLARLPR